MHPAIAGHVSHDLADCDHLGVCKSERQRVLESAGKLTPILKCNSAASFSLESVGSAMKDMDEEQLLEREPRPAARAFGNRRWAVHHPNRVAQTRQTGGPEDIRGQIFLEERQQSVEVTIDDSPNDLKRQTFRRRVDREDLSLSYVILILAELDVLAGLKLSAVKEADGTR